MDDEIKGEGNSLNYTYRMHDPRVGRFFAIDPLEVKFPWNSPYVFSENQVIMYKEFEGLQVTRPGLRNNNNRTRFRSNRNRQLYRLNQAKQQADFHKLTTFQARRQFSVLETDAVMRHQHIINKYELQPEETGDPIGGKTGGRASNVVKILEKTIDLIDNMKETVKKEAYNFTGVDRFSLKVGGNTYQFPGVSFSKALELNKLENEYQNVLRESFDQYYSKKLEAAKAKGDGSDVLLEQNYLNERNIFDFQYKLENGLSPKELFKATIEESIEKGDFKKVDEKIKYTDKVRQG